MTNKTKTELDAIADEIINYSDGSFYMEWGEEFEALNEADQKYVEDQVYAAIGNCSLCGWHFTSDSMDVHDSDGEPYCWRCYEEVTAEEEEDED